jgi:spermidine/putrescine transport system permease protein
MKKSDLKSAIKKERFFFAMVPAVVWQGLFLFLPLLFLVVISFIKGWSYTGVHGGFTLENYTSLLDFSHLRVLFRSFFLALINTTVCLLVAFPVSYFISVKSRRWKNCLLFFLVVPFFTNFLVLVYSWFFILERNGVINKFLSLFGLGVSGPLLYNMPAVLLVMVYCYLPFMAMPIYSSLEKIDKSLLEASSDLGANFRQTFFKVVLPMAFSGIRTGVFLVFVPSFGEFVIPTLIGKGEPFLVGSLVSYYFTQSLSPSFGAAFTSISCVFLVIVAFLWFVLLKLIFTKNLRGSDNGKN